MSLFAALRVHAGETHAMTSPTPNSPARSSSTHKSTDVQDGPLAYLRTDSAFMGSLSVVGEVAVRTSLGFGRSPADRRA